MGYQSGMTGGCCYEDFFYDSARYDIPGLTTGGFMFLGMDRSVAHCTVWKADFILCGTLSPRGRFGMWAGCGMCGWG